MPQLEAAGETLSYLKAGTDGRAMLLIHGFASDARSWGLNQPAWAANATVYAIDLPGHGLLPAKAFGGLDRLAEIVLAAMDVLSSEYPLHIVGHSMGGAIALRTAALAPDRVRALSLIAPAGLGAPANRRFLNDLLAMTDEASARAALQDLVANPAILSPQIVTGILAARHRAHTYASWQAMAPVGAEIFMRAAELIDSYGKLPMPAHVIWGSADRVLPPPLAELPGLHRLDGLGHVPHMEAFRAVNTMVGAIGG